MEMEGRGFSDLLRNTSEEIFLKTMMENPIGISAPSMEMLGFKNITQTFRGDSEELFNSWLMNGEIPGYSSSVGLRNRQASRRISSDHSSTQQNGVSFQKKNNDENASHHHVVTTDEHSNDASQGSLRNAAEKGMHAGNLYLAKAWFNSSQPMTRSRSSELRRRYAAMQSSQIAAIPPAPSNIPGQDTHGMKQVTNANSFCDVMRGEMSFISPSNSSISFNAPPLARSDTVSSVVSMLKGTLERKKLNSKVDKEIFEGSSCGMFSSQVAVKNINCNERLPNQVTGLPTAFQMISSMQITTPGNLSKIEKCADLNMEGFPTPANHGQVGAASREPSQSESSTAAPTLSTGFDVCDGPAHSGHTISNSVSSRRYGNGTSDHEMKANDFKERIFDNSFNDARKKGNLVRMGSISSGASVDRTDQTKKRRVERSRKMAEAKEKNSTPPLPSDMQSVMKRCENLEKEVRSLKLNLSFMNRKDSEQTKQIEELQKQNEELAVDKGRLLEEIERVISNSSKM